MDEAPSPSPRPRRRNLRKYRGLLAVALFAGLWVIGKATGLLEGWDQERIRTMVEASGALGVLAFIAAFSVGELLHVPGMVFVAAAIVLWGALWGFAISFGAALVSVLVSFFLVRAVGGKALAEMERPLVKRLLSRLDRRPIQTVALLRLVLWLAPALNYALAMTNVRPRDYLVGSALGLFLPIAAGSAVFAWLLL